MTTRGLKKLALTAHITASVGWIGAILASLALAIAGMTSRDPATVRSAYLALDLMGRFVLVPFALAALAGGLAQSIITPWGLIRHYWVIFKLLITTFATVVLLMYVPTLEYLADVAAKPSWSATDLAVLRTPSVLLHTTAATVLLLLATVLAVFKPRGVTPYGQRKLREERDERVARGA